MHDDDYIIDDMAVCVDCAQVIANDDYPEDDTLADTIAQQILESSAEGYVWVLDDRPGQDSTFFSWSTCDLCGSSLGGDRFPAALIRFA